MISVRHSYVTLALIASLFGTPTRADLTQWYIRKAGSETPLGPYTQSEILERIRNGTIDSSDSVTSDSISWKQVGESGQFTDPEKAPSPTVSESSESQTTKEEKSKEPISNKSNPAPKETLYFAPQLGIAVRALPSLGIEAGIHSGNLDFGVFSNFIKESTAISGRSIDVETVTLLASGTIRTGILYCGLRFGLGIRTLKASVSSSTQSSTGSSSTSGLVLGLHIPIGTTTSITLEAMLLSIKDLDAYGPLGSFTLSSSGYLTTSAGIRFGL